MLVDDVTELYNLRAMYRDAQMMTGYCVRNHLPISLMIIQMRYESELRGMLSHSRYIQLRKRLAELVMDSVRVEDKVYCIDEHGTMAFRNMKRCVAVFRVLFCDLRLPEYFHGGAHADQQTFYSRTESFDIFVKTFHNV